MRQMEYTVSEAAEFLHVKPHVLRYWEEELQLSINRNELGHRYYTIRDMQILFRIQEMKRDGMALREIGKVVSAIYIEETASEIVMTPEEKKEELFRILDKLVKSREAGVEAAEDSEEFHYKKLDKIIRSQQVKRKLIAATAENEKKRKKKKRYLKIITGSAKGHVPEW